MVSCFLENINEIAVWLHEKNREECVEIKPVVVSVCPRQRTVCASFTYLCVSALY